MAMLQRSPLGLLAQTAAETADTVIFWFFNGFLLFLIVLTYFLLVFIGFEWFLHPLESNPTDPHRFPTKHFFHENYFFRK